MAIEVTKTWSSDGYNGLLDWLGKDKGTTTWAHPETTRAYVATAQISTNASLTSDNAIDQAIDTTSGRSHTTNADFMPWWYIDFGASNSVVCTRFGIIGQNHASNQPHRFGVYASVDGEHWTELYDSDGTNINQATWTSFAVSDTTKYRYFMIRGNGLYTDSSSNQYLILGDVEIWGEYHDVAADTGQVFGAPSNGAGWTGLFEWLGQNKTGIDDTAWAHPETSRSLVTTSQSTVHSGLVSENAINHDLFTSGRAHTTNVAGSWWKVDLGSGNTFRMDAFGLFASVGSEPRNFRMEGSNDDSAWTEIYDVPDGSTGPAAYGWFLAETAGAGASEAYRYFRITQYGTNLDGNNYFAIGSIEFYGEWNPSAGGGGGGAAGSMLILGAG